jgi:hypothetical protein
MNKLTETDQPNPTLLIAILLSRLGGKVTITDDEFMTFEMKDVKLKSYYDHKNMAAILEITSSNNEGEV